MPTAIYFTPVTIFFTANLLSHHLKWKHLARTINSNYNLYSVSIWESAKSRWKCQVVRLMFACVPVATSTWGVDGARFRGSAVIAPWAARLATCTVEHDAANRVQCLWGILLDDNRTARRQRPREKTVHDRSRGLWRWSSGEGRLVSQVPVASCMHLFKPVVDTQTNCVMA